MTFHILCVISADISGKGQSISPQSGYRDINGGADARRAKPNSQSLSNLTNARQKQLLLEATTTYRLLTPVSAFEQFFQDLGSFVSLTPDSNLIKGNTGL
jgi:hypothetical protein